MSIVNLGIVSWNIGNNVKKVNSLIEELSNDDNIFGGSSTPDILVLGCQELKPINTLFAPSINNYTLIDFFITCRVSSFGIGIFIYRRTNSSVQVERVRELFSYCPLKDKVAKGFECISLKIKGIDEIVIANAHFPLRNIESLKRYYNLLQEYLTEHRKKNSNTIIFGDLNSRSVLTKNFVKYIEDLDEKNEPYCNLTVGEMINFLKDKQIDYKEDPRDEHQKCLQNTDVFRNPKLYGNSGLFDDYEESLDENRHIPFNPTYRFNKESGLYSLVEKKIRLPGYPDRILYKIKDKKNIKMTKYGTINFKGNDHMPIYGLFTLKLKNGSSKSYRIRSDAIDLTNDDIYIPKAISMDNKIISISPSPTSSVTRSSFVDKPSKRSTRKGNYQRLSSPF